VDDGAIGSRSLPAEAVDVIVQRYRQWRKDPDAFVANQNQPGDLRDELVFSRAVPAQAVGDGDAVLTPWTYTAPPNGDPAGAAGVPGGTTVPPTHQQLALQRIADEQELTGYLESLSLAAQAYTAHVSSAADRN
jgi:hypothetical protein